MSTLDARRVDDERGSLRSNPLATARTLPPLSARGRPRGVIVASLVGAVLAVAPGSSAREAAPPSAGIATAKYTASGRVVRWYRDPVTLSVDAAMSSSLSGAPAAVTLAAGAWAGSGAFVPSLRVDVVAHAEDEGRDGPDGLNVVRIADDDFTMPSQALAVTRLTFSADTGEIVDADILIDASHHKIAVLDDAAPAPDAYDLQALVTHEIGHALGLGEDYDDEGATMYPKERPGDTTKRVLTDADRTAIAGVYEQGPSPADTSAGGCATSGRRVGTTSIVAIALVALLAAFAGRRRGEAALVAAVLLWVPATSNAMGDEAYVASKTARWEGGSILSTVQLRDRSGAALESMILPGGTVGAHGQIVAGMHVPEVGARVSRSRLRRRSIRARQP